MKTCKECFAELSKTEIASATGKCSECLPVKKKDKPFKKQLSTEDEKFLPQDEGKTWFRVPSIYRAYKE